MEKQIVTQVGKLMVSGQVAEAFLKASQELAQALKAAEEQEKPTVAQAIDRLAQLDQEMEPVSREIKSLRNLLKQEMPNQGRVTTEAGNAAVTYQSSNRSFDYENLNRMIQAAKDRRDFRTVGTLQKVLTECVKLSTTNNLKINP